MRWCIFWGETALGVMSSLRHTTRFRWKDCLYEMQQCGALALPIVGLVSFLVGVTLAYTGAIVLRQYGGDIYVADLVGLSMVREMGAMMTAGGDCRPDGGGVCGPVGEHEGE